MQYHQAPESFLAKYLKTRCQSTVHIHHILLMAWLRHLLRSTRFPSAHHSASTVKRNAQPGLWVILSACPRLRIEDTQARGSSLLGKVRPVCFWYAPCDCFFLESLLSSVFILLALLNPISVQQTRLNSLAPHHRTIAGPNALRTRPSHQGLQWHPILSALT